MFEDLATVDFQKVWDGRFVLFCFIVTVISVGISALIALLWKDKAIRGEFIQVSYRSSAALLGGSPGKLVAIFVMLGSATTVSCFVIAKNMKHEGVLTSSVVMLSTLFSAFTLTGFIL